MAVNRVGLQIKRIHFFKPRIFVRRKHAVWLACQRQYLITLKNHVVLKGVKSSALAFKQGLHFGVSSQCLGLVVVVGKHRIDFQLLAQLGYGVAGYRMLHDQA